LSLGKVQSAIEFVAVVNVTSPRIGHIKVFKVGLGKLALGAVIIAVV